MPTASDDLPYRPCVGVLLFNEDGLVFVAQRIDTPGAWQMPQGGIDKGETPEAAALRELEEETGTNRAEIVAETPNWISYDLPEDLIGKVWKGRFRGQKQKWFAMQFTGTDADIGIQNVVKPEFDDWRWVTIDEVVELIVPFKRQVYEQVVAAFRQTVLQAQTKTPRNG